MALPNGFLIYSRQGNEEAIRVFRQRERVSAVPKAAPSRCTMRCGAFATKNGRCEEHQRKAWENTSARNRAMTSTEWTPVARAHLANEPRCRGCQSTDNLQVDHITEIADDGAPLDPNNLQTLCEDCHRAKTKAARALRAARRGLSR